MPLLAITTASREMIALVVLFLVTGALRLFDRSFWGTLGGMVGRRTRGWRGPLVVLVFALLVRGALIPRLGYPVPQEHDEFSYVLMSDTFAHGRLTNPTPPSWQHFETFHENMVPTYNSKYPPAQGIALAFGQRLFGQPWYGVYLSTALMVAAVCWALGGLLRPEWVFFGGILCSLRLCVLGYWVNTYWGGSVTALGGALTLGAGIRLLRAEAPRARDGFVLGFGLVTLALSRPLEGSLFALPIVIAVLARWIHSLRSLQPLHSPNTWLRTAAACLVPIAAGAAFLLYYNFRTTGNVLLLPYFVYERNYNTAPLFILAKLREAPHYHHAVMAAFYDHWAWEASLYHNPLTLLAFENVRFHLLWDFYLGLSLTIPFVIGVWSLRRDPIGRVVLASVLLVMLGYAVVLAFHIHYVAAATAGVFVIAVAGWQHVWTAGGRWGRTLAGSLALIALVFALGEKVSKMYMFHGIRTRQQVDAALERLPGQHLVRVQYLPGHGFDTELVYNSADFGSQKVLWARQMSPAEDRELCQVFPHRDIWDLATDDKMVSLKPSALCTGSR